MLRTLSTLGSTQHSQVGNLSQHNSKREVRFTVISAAVNSIKSSSRSNNSRRANLSVYIAASIAVQSHCEMGSWSLFSGIQSVHNTPTPVIAGVKLQRACKRRIEVLLTGQNGRRKQSSPASALFKLGRRVTMRSWWAENSSWRLHNSRRCQCRGKQGGK